jgi:hypothetical protein
MPGSFRRAHLRGSDELFRPTRPDEDALTTATSSVTATGRAAERNSPGTAHAEEALGVQRHEGHLLRLTDEEIEILVDAVQKLKYPTATKVPTKPPMDVYERLEELRQKLLGHR